MNTAMKLLAGIVCLAGLAKADDLAISTDNTTLFLTKYTSVHQLYYGRRLANPAEVKTLGGWKPEAYPTFGGWNMDGGLKVVHTDGSSSLELTFVSWKLTEEGPTVSHAVVELKDKVQPFFVTLHYRACKDTDVIETWAEYRHTEAGPVRLQRMDSVALGFTNVPKDCRMLSFPSTWGSEMKLQEDKLTVGIKRLDNRAGVRAGFGANPSFLLSFDGPAQENTGRVLAGALAWSGAWQISFDRDLNDLLSINAGINAEVVDYNLAPATVFETPKFIMTWSDQGTGQASRNLHRWARNYQMRDGSMPRPVLLNSWEGAYFKFDEAKLISMMDGVKKLGGEMFVLDDGWFANGEFARDDDKRGLGDWQVNAKKLPGGIAKLTAAAKERGLKFGIWVEPEMVNPKSQLFKDHPDWVIQIPGRELLLSRSQAVLDLSNPAVQDFVFGFMDKLLTENPEIAYIKWDANRDFANVGSASQTKENQANIWVDYTRGLYSTLEKIQKKHPNVIFKACGSGGGRIDYGYLHYAHEFWSSDDTDAMQRIFIQWGIGQFYPANGMACHVSVVPNHQTGRITPLKFRFDVAMTGRMGFELNPEQMTPADLAFAQTAVECYKNIRSVVQQGDLYRLVSPYEGNCASLMYATPDRQRAVVFAYRLRRMVGENDSLQLRLQGVDPKLKYRITELNRTDLKKSHSEVDGKVVSGELLREAGLPVNLRGEFESAVFELVAE